MLRIVFFVVVFILSIRVEATPEKAVIGKVTRITSHTVARNPYDASKLGMIMLHVDNLPGACGTVHKRVAIGSDHPLFSTVTSVVLTAQAQGKEIQLGYLESCTVHANSWDFSYIILNQ